MRFTIRDLMWLAAIVGLGIVWISAERRAASYRATFESNQKIINDLQAYNVRLLRDQNEQAMKMERLGLVPPAPTN